MMFQAGTVATTAIGQRNPVAIGFFFVFISITLGITYWAARRTKTTEQFYAAGAIGDRRPERLGAGRRLYERGLVLRDRRAGVDDGL